MNRLVAAGLVLILPCVASAGAREDIAELRHGRAASHQTLLGWTVDGRAITRRLVCSEGGELSCQASIDALKVGAAESHTLLWRNEASLYDAATAENPKGPISTAEATAFIRKEAAALAAVGPLVAGTSVADPAQAFGTIGGEPTTIYLRTSSHPSGEEALRLHVAVRGPYGVSVDLERLDDAPWRVDAQQVLDASVSPDGSAVWMALHYVDGVMCWDGEDIELTIADLARVRAKLANAAGLRAYQGGDLDEAQALFEEATAEDPGYAWGWFNRGALESDRGALADAATSLGAAIEIDEAFGARACGDEDYAALENTAEGARLMACGYEEGC